MKIVVIHGHSVESLIFNTCELIDLYLFNCQWKRLKKFCQRAGLKLQGFPSLAFIYIDENLDVWERIWQEWSSGVGISSAFSWDCVDLSGEREDIIELLLNSQEKFLQFCDPSLPYKPFIKSCDLCGRKPFDIKDNGKTLCSICYPWYKKKERILSWINFPYESLTVVQVSFNLWENVIKENPPAEAFDIYRQYTDTWNSFKVRGRRQGMLLYQDRDQMTFILNRRRVFQFIETVREKLSPFTIMITVAEMPARSSEGKEIKTGEFLLFTYKRLQILKEKAIPWHMQWIYSENYIKMPKYLYDLSEGMDWNSFRLLKDCLERFHRLFLYEDRGILKNIFHREEESSINYDLAKFQFLCKLEQKEYLDFLVNNIGYKGIRDILKYEGYFSLESTAVQE